MSLKLTERNPNLPKTSQKIGLKPSFGQAKSVRKALNDISNKTVARTSIKTRESANRIGRHTNVKKQLTFKAYSDEVDDEESIDEEYSHIDLNAPIESTSYVEREMTLDDFYPELKDRKNIENQSMTSKPESYASLKSNEYTDLNIKIEEKDIFDPLVIDFESMF